MTIEFELIAGLMAGLVAVLIGLVGIIYTNLKDRVVAMESKMDGKLDDIFRYARHEVRNVNNNVHMLATEFIRSANTDMLDMIKRNEGKEWKGYRHSKSGKDGVGYGPG